MTWLNKDSNLWYEDDFGYFDLNWDNDIVRLSKEDVRKLIPILEKFLCDI